MKTIKQMSEEYARKAHFASGVNPNLIESVVYEALTEFKKLQQPDVIKSVCELHPEAEIYFETETKCRRFGRILKKDQSVL